MKHKQFFLIHPWLYSEMGHSYIYSQSLQKAVEINGWQFAALLPQKTLLKDLPTNWFKVLDCPTVRHWYQEVENKPYRRPRKYVRAQQRWRYYHSLYSFLKKKMKEQSDCSFVLFMEAFAESDVRLLSHLLKFLPAKRVTVGLIHRYQSTQMGSEVYKYRKHHERIMHSGASLYLFTDSDLLKEDLEKALYYPFEVLPIHYIEQNLWSPLKKMSPIKCWWPGLVRPGKGLEVVQQFAHSSHPMNQSIELLFNEEATIERGKKGPIISKLPALLDRQDYLNRLHDSQIILLPYTDPHYQKATSSIFIEAIMSGRIPLVYPETWMAYELEKFGLHQLIMDCQPQNLSEKITGLSRAELIHEKLERMRRNYLDFHDLENYAAVLKKSLSF